jgi:hypothetical protein
MEQVTGVNKVISAVASVNPLVLIQVPLSIEKSVNVVAEVIGMGALKV